MITYYQSLTLSCDDFVNKGDSSKTVSQGRVGVSLLSGNTGLCSFTQIISDATEGLVWTVAVLVKEDSWMVGEAWCGIIGGDKGCNDGGCTWGDVVDCWCCFLMSSIYI